MDSHFRVSLSCFGLCLVLCPERIAKDVPGGRPQEDKTRKPKQVVELGWKAFVSLEEDVQGVSKGVSKWWTSGVQASSRHGRLKQLGFRSLGGKAEEAVCVLGGCLCEGLGFVAHAFGEGAQDMGEEHGFVAASFGFGA